MHVIIYLSKPTEYNNTKSEPLCKLGFWQLITMRQYRFIDRGGLFIMGDIMHVPGTGKPLYLSLNFVVNLKIS